MRSWRRAGRRPFAIATSTVALAIVVCIGSVGFAAADPTDAVDPVTPGNSAAAPWKTKLCAPSAPRPPASLTFAPEGTPRSVPLPAVPGGPIYGDPAAASRYWQMQTQNDCALMSIRLVLAELNQGKAPSEAELVQLATHTDSDCTPGAPVYDITLHPEDDPLGSLGHGVCPGDIPKLMKHYGVGSTATNDVIATEGGPATGLPRLLALLAEGRKVIAGVNCETLWNTDGDRSSGDHAIVVAAVDTAKNLVYLGDSGGPDTRGEQITIEHFESAWKPSDHTLVVTDRAA